MPTTNPVPSLDPSDLLFNAGRLDQVVNGSTQYYTDRLGVNRRTVEGINAAADVVLGGIGYAPPVAYAAGISMTLTTQTVEYSGEIYAPKVASLPFTTSTWATDSAKFRLIQGVAAADLAASGGSSMIGYMPVGTGAVATTVEAKLREIVSVKDFKCADGLPVQGDGVHDDTTGIQAAINSITNATFATTWSGGIRVYTKGGGEVIFPPGRYRITDTLLVGQHCRLLGCSTAGYLYPVGSGVTGSQIIADFADPNKWIIDSANYDSAGNRIGYRDNISGADIDAGTYNSTHGIEIENLYVGVKAGTSAYGGVRLCGSPNAKLRNINVNGTDVGYMVNASWGVTAIQLQSQTYLYGFVAMIDANGVQVEGYFDSFSGKTINDTNRLTGLLLSDFNSTVGLPDWTNKRFGLLCYYTNATMCNRVITEGWDVARVYVQCRGFSENAMYVERNSDAYLGVASSQGVFNSMHQYNPSITTGYYFGYNADVTLIGMPVSNIGGTTNIYSDIKIHQSKADLYGWKHYDNATYIGNPTGVIRVAAAGSPYNIANDTTYTTIDEAMRRIVASPLRDWKVIVKDGDFIETGSVAQLVDKNITFVKEGAGLPCSLAFGVVSGIIKRWDLLGNISLRFDKVDLGYTAGTSPSDATVAAGLFIAQSDASNVSIGFNDCTIALQSAYAIIQQGYNSSSNISASFNQCTITGTDTARIMSGAYANTAHTNVVNSAYACTVPANVKAIGANGWENANVISSNF